jgi:hypothetical protein
MYCTPSRFHLLLFNRPNSVRWGTDYDKFQCVIVLGRLQFGPSVLRNKLARPSRVWAHCIAWRVVERSKLSPQHGSMKLAVLRRCVLSLYVFHFRILFVRGQSAVTWMTCEPYTMHSVSPIKRAIKQTGTFHPKQLLDVPVLFKSTCLSACVSLSWSRPLISANLLMNLVLQTYWLSSRYVHCTQEKYTIELHRRESLTS